MVRAGYREAQADGVAREYLPSTTELLLEDLCRSWNTSLLPATLGEGNTSKLVRLSQPAVFDEGKKLLQVQWTRFSPLKSLRAIPTYKHNRKGRKITDGKA